MPVEFRIIPWGDRSLRKIRVNLYISSLWNASTVNTHKHLYLVLLIDTYQGTRYFAIFTIKYSINNITAALMVGPIYHQVPGMYGPP